MKLYGNKLKIVAIIIIAISITVILLIKKHSTGDVVKTALSADAHYAITTDAKNNAVLWDLQKHTKTILSHNANMYSAYWVLNTPYYLWQSLKEKTVHVINVNRNKEVSTIQPKTLAYGEALSQNLKNYVMSDVNWNIYLLQNKRSFQLARNYTSGTFEGANKIINFTFLDNNKILSSGMAYPTGDLQWGPTLWDLNQKKPIRNYIGNMVQTFATISPDGKYVVAGDGNGANLFVWNTNTGKRVYRGANIYSGIANTHNSEDYRKWTHDNSQLIKMPSDFASANVGGTIQSIKFIDKDHYLVFHNGSYYAILYSVHSPWPIKYLNLGAHPMPALKYFERDQSMDTSPSTHTLVMAKETAPGILVYKYNPKTQTLEKVWDAS